MSACVFCRIVAGELPSARIFEDEAVLAFLDIAPIIKGHTLVIPKAHYEALTDVPPDLLARTMQVVQRVMMAQRLGLSAHGVNLHLCLGAAAGQVVPHAHFHVIPRYLNDGHHWNWRAGRYADHSEMQDYGDRIRRAMRP